MELGQKTTTNTPEQNQPENSAELENTVEQGLSAVKKPGKGLIVGMILCGVLAVAGIGFGVWAMMDGGEQKERLTEQSSALKKQNEEYAGQISDLKTKNEELQASVDELSDVNNQAQNSQEQPVSSDNDERTAEGTTEGGYNVVSIGRCIFDAGPVPGQGLYILKCEAETSLGKGKFVWDSDRGELFFTVALEN